jgi:hypothetical protein
VLQLARDPRLLEEARAERALLGTLGAKFLEGHVAAEVTIVGQPHAPDTTRGVQTEAGVALARPRDMVHGCQLLRGRAWHGQVGERTLNVVVLQGRQGAFDVVGDSRQPGPRVAAVLVQLACEQVVHMCEVVGHDPAALDEQVGEGHVFTARPEHACFDELVGVDQISLESQDAEQQVTVGVHANLREGQPAMGSKRNIPEVTGQGHRRDTDGDSIGCE